VIVQAIWAVSKAFTPSWLGYVLAQAPLASRNM
jgi:hypothetical protein